MYCQELTSKDVFDMVGYYAENLDSSRALSVLIPYMDWEHSSVLIDHGGELNRNIWQNEHQRELTTKSVAADMVDFMPHAWELVTKRRHHHTIEALDHMQIWLYLMGEHSLSESMKSYGEHDYGATELAIVCQHFNLDCRQMDPRPRLVH